MAELTRRQTLSGATTLALWLLPILPAAYLVTLIARYGVNVPFADEFTLAPLLVKAHSHSLTFSDLFAQHNEHRYVFPRLLFIAFAAFTKGNLVAEMFFSVALAALSAFNLWIVLRRTVERSLERSLFLMGLFSLLFFSPVQAENWMWGFQFPLFFCNFLFTCGLVVASSRLGLAKKCMLNGAIAAVATFSFGGGILLWAVTFPFAIVAEEGARLRARVGWFVVWTGLAAAAIGLYFFRYVKPPHHPGLAASGHVQDYFLYVATFLGAHLSKATRLEPILQAAAIGTVLLCLYLGAAFYVCRYFRDKTLLRRTMPWFAVGAYPLLNASLAALARIGFGVNQGQDSRYTSFSLYLSISVIGLITIVFDHVRRRSSADRPILALVRFETVLLTAFVVFYLSSFSWGIQSMAATQRARLLGKAALLFTNVLEDGAIHDRYLSANAHDARRFANMEDRLGLIHPPMIRSAEIARLNPKTKSVGFLDQIVVSGQSCRVTGWAMMPKQDRPADGVILSFEKSEGSAIAFRVADEFFERTDVATVLKNKDLTNTGWSCSFDRSLVPAGDHLLRAWAFDAKKGVLYPLDTPKNLP
jgi:hypothetical protein